MVGVSGGGAFVLVYLLCVAFIAIPILIGELLIGRMGGHSPPVATRMVAEDSGRSKHWSVVGWMGVIAGFLIANLAIAMMMAAAIFLNFKLPSAYRTRSWVLVGAVFSTVVLVASAVVSGWGLVGKLGG